MAKTLRVQQLPLSPQCPHGSLSLSTCYPGVNEWEVNIAVDATPRLLKTSSGTFTLPQGLQAIPDRSWTKRTHPQ